MLPKCFPQVWINVCTAVPLSPRKYMQCENSTEVQNSCRKGFSMPGSTLQLATFNILGHTWEQYFLDPKSELHLLGIKRQDLEYKIFLCVLKSACLEVNGLLALIFLGFSLLCGGNQSCTFGFSWQDLWRGLQLCLWAFDYHHLGILGILRTGDVFITKHCGAFNQIRF